MFIGTLYTSLIDKWSINNKEEHFNDFGLKIRIFEISKIKLFEKKYFTENCSSDTKVSSVILL